MHCEFERDNSKAWAIYSVYAMSTEAVEARR